MAQPMSYLLFKLKLEMAHISTFNNDWRVQELYKEYLNNFDSKGDVLPDAIVKFCKK